MNHLSTHKESRPKVVKASMPFFNSVIQKKLSIGSSNDFYEVEADKVANRVMKMQAPSPQNISQTGALVQKKCTACNEEEKIQKKSLAESITPLVQRSSLFRSNESHASLKVESQINSTRGAGNSMDNGTKNFMESRFGADFSGVKIHTGTQAVQMSRELNAQAFTVGNDIYFNEGKYNPNSDSGKHLLAHELTHTVQQNGSQQQINRSPNPAPPPSPYIPGRPAHNHPALGNWSAVQANALSVCARNVRILPLPIPIPIPTSTRGRAECACATMTPLQVLNLAKIIEMHGKPLAVQHLEHYISGGGVDFMEHTNLDNLMKTDAGARGVVTRAIALADRGNVFIQQSDYSDQNFRLAFGGIDRVDYLVDRAASTVDVWFKDRYDFHPAGFGYKNMGTGDSAPPGRVTNCVHLAAVEAKSTGAADYWMIGHATLPLSLFVAPAASSGSGTI